MAFADDLVNEFKARIGSGVVSAGVAKPRRIYAEVKPESMREAAKFLFWDKGARFAIASGQERPERFEVLYHFAFDSNDLLFNLRVATAGKENPTLPSLAAIAPAFNWIERELHDLLGLEWEGRDETAPLLRAMDGPEAWPEGLYPLRTDVPTGGDREGADL